MSALKSTGIIRRIDDLGRVVIPKEIRRIMRVKEGDPLEIFPTEDGILFKKYDSTKTIEEVLHELEDLVNNADELGYQLVMQGLVKDFKMALRDERKA